MRWPLVQFYGGCEVLRGWIVISREVDTSFWHMALWGSPECMPFLRIGFVWPNPWRPRWRGYFTWIRGKQRWWPTWESHVIPSAQPAAVRRVGEKR